MTFPMREWKWEKCRKSQIQTEAPHIEMGAHSSAHYRKYNLNGQIFMAENDSVSWLNLLLLLLDCVCVIRQIPNRNTFLSDDIVVCQWLWNFVAARFYFVIIACCCSYHFEMSCLFKCYAKTNGFFLLFLDGFFSLLLCFIWFRFRFEMNVNEMGFFFLFNSKQIKYQRQSVSKNEIIYCYWCRSSCVSAVMLSSLLSVSHVFGSSHRHRYRILREFGYMTATTELTEKPTEAHKTLFIFRHVLF